MAAATSRVSSRIPGRGHGDPDWKDGGDVALVGAHAGRTVGDPHLGNAQPFDAVKGEGRRTGHQRDLFFQGQPSEQVVDAGFERPGRIAEVGVALGVFHGASSLDFAAEPRAVGRVSQGEKHPGRRLSLSPPSVRNQIRPTRDEL